MDLDNGDDDLINSLVDGATGGVSNGSDKTPESVSNTPQRASAS